MGSITCPGCSGTGNGTRRIQVSPSYYTYEHCGYCGGTGTMWTPDPYRPPRGDGVSITGNSEPGILASMTVWFAVKIPPLRWTIKAGYKLVQAGWRARLPLIVAGALAANPLAQGTWVERVLLSLFGAWAPVAATALGALAGSLALGLAGGVVVYAAGLTALIFSVAVVGLVVFAVYAGAAIWFGWAMPF